MIDFIPVNEPLLNGNEKKYLDECIDTGWISSEGPFIKRFEEGIASMAGRKYAVAVANGTAAIDAAVTALGIGRYDEVIVPAFTIISCLTQIIRLGARPVLVDSDRITWNMDVSQIESKITSKTKAYPSMSILFWHWPRNMVSKSSKMLQRCTDRLIGADRVEVLGI